MYIEFLLPRTMLTGMIANDIRHHVIDWAKQHGVPDSAYSQKTIKNTHRLSFGKPSYFSLFSMTWNKHDYQIIDVVNEKY